jgi:hypothetical protein
MPEARLPCGRALRRLHALAAAYIHTYMHTYIHTYIRSLTLRAGSAAPACACCCIHTYIHTCIHTYIHTYIRSLTLRASSAAPACACCCAVSSPSSAAMRCFCSSIFTCFRQHTSAYVSMRQHTSAYVRSAASAPLSSPASVSTRQHTSAYVSMRQHTSDPLLLLLYLHLEVLFLLLRPHALVA